MVMATVGVREVHPNGSHPGVPAPALAPASLIGKTLAVTRPAVRRAAVARAIGRAWRAFQPSALSTAGYGCAAAAAYVAAGLWPGLLATAAGLILLHWQNEPGPAPVVIDAPVDPDGGGA